MRHLRSGKTIASPTREEIQRIVEEANGKVVWSDSDENENPIKTSTKPKNRQEKKNAQQQGNSKGEIDGELPNYSGQRREKVSDKALTSQNGSEEENQTGDGTMHLSNSFAPLNTEANRLTVDSKIQGDKSPNASKHESTLGLDSLKRLFGEERLQDNRRGSPSLFSGRMDQIKSMQGVMTTFQDTLMGLIETKMDGLNAKLEEGLKHFESMVMGRLNVLESKIEELVDCIKESRVEADNSSRKEVQNPEEKKAQLNEMEPKENKSKENRPSQKQSQDQKENKLARNKQTLDNRNGFRYEIKIQVLDENQATIQEIEKRFRTFQRIPYHEIEEVGVNFFKLSIICPWYFAMLLQKRRIPLDSRWMKVTIWDPDIQLREDSIWQLKEVEFETKEALQRWRSGAPNSTRSEDFGVLEPRGRNRQGYRPQRGWLAFNGIKADEIRMGIKVFEGHSHCQKCHQSMVCQCSGETNVTSTPPPDGEGKQ